jgi:exosome complex component RRP4
MKVKAVQPRSVTLTAKEKGLGKVTSGLITRVSPVRVARIIGKKGSMIATIKEVTKTKIVVGQNGLIWIKGENAESELLAKEAIELVAENPLLDGLTEKVKEYLEKKVKK